MNAVLQLTKKPDGVVIGSRWTPAHIERRDTATGFYEEVNSDLRSETERTTQLALLAPVDWQTGKRLQSIQQLRRHA